MQMPNSIGHSARSHAADEASGSVGTRGRPDWCAPFLAELRRQRDKYSACNTRLAADIAGVHWTWLYRYSKSDLGRSFRIEWDTIVLEARRFHSFLHR